MAALCVLVFAAYSNSFQAGLIFDNAQVILRDPNLWYETVEVDKGSDDGVRIGNPVTGDGALVGEVTVVDPTVSVVTLITDHTMAVAARVQDSRIARSSLRNFNGGSRMRTRNHISVTYAWMH